MWKDRRRDDVVKGGGGRCGVRTKWRRGRIKQELVIGADGASTIVHGMVVEEICRALQGPKHGWRCRRFKGNWNCQFAQSRRALIRCRARDIKRRRPRSPFSPKRNRLGKPKQFIILVYDWYIQGVYQCRANTNIRVSNQLVNKLKSG